PILLRSLQELPGGGSPRRCFTREPVRSRREKLFIAKMNSGEGFIRHFAEEAVQNVLHVMERISRAVAQKVKRTEGWNGDNKTARRCYQHFTDRRRETRGIADAAGAKLGESLDHAGDCA